MSLTTLGVILFIVALLASIMLHEAGHFLTARAFGMKVTQYFLGFGPTLWSVQRGETEYGVKAIPAGGFVKIVGMTQLEDVEPEDERRAFWRQPAPQRFVVLVAGSLTHFVLALLIAVPTFAAFGKPEQVPSTLIGQVSECVPATPADLCQPGDPAPAKAAGLKKGDRVVEFQGRPVRDWDTDFAKPLRASDGPVTIVVDRDGVRVPVTVTPVRRTRPDPETKVPVNVAQIGVVNHDEIIYNDLSPVAAVTESIRFMGRNFAGAATLIVKLPDGIRDTFLSTVRNEERDVGEAAPISLVGATRLGGQALDAGDVATFLMIVVSINVVVGFLNLLPLLPLDGGHIAILLFEQVRSRVYPLIGLRDPGRVDIMKLQPVALAVILFFGVMTVVLLYSDIVNPIANPF
jgi:membrane-associated protease RseP (regulator of RpoE activity)